MGLLDRIRERRSVTVESDTLLAEILNTTEITKKEALNIPAVSSCVDFIAGKIAELPIKLCRDIGNETEEVKDDERVALLNDSTGDMLTPYDMKRAVVTDYLLEGSAYIYPERAGNRIKALRYIEKNKISVEVSPDPIYKSAVYRVNTYKFYDWQLVRLCRNTKDGARGIGIIAQAPEMLIITYKSMIYEKYLVANGGNKKGFLKSERKLEKAAVEELKDAWKKLYSNNGNNMMLLNGGIDFKESSNTSVEMQLNEQKRTNNDYICQLFNLSPSVVSGEAGEDTYIASIKTAVIPIIVAFENALNQALLLESERKEYYFVVDTSELLKGDILKRYQAYQIALQNNFLQPDEVRYKEDFKPLGFNYIKLGLQDVLLDPKTGVIYTPNTNQTTKFGESANISSVEETRDNDYIQDPETGQMQGSRPSGNSSKSGGKSDESIEKSEKSDTIEMKELHLQEQLAYIMPNGEKDFIPNNTLISKRKVIAGAGSRVRLRVEQQLVDKYGGKVGEWQKCVGKVESSKYIFDVHWYELNKKQYETKVKNRSDKK